MMTGWPCGAAGDVHRPLDLKKPPLVVERPDPRRVDIVARCFVGDDGVVVPAIPQTFDDIDKFVRDLVAQIVLHVALAAEIERRLGGGAGDDVPRRAAEADMVDRGKGAGDVIGLAKAGRDRGAKPEMPGRRSQYRDQGRRLEAAQKRRMVARVHDEPVGDEQQVEFAALGDAGDLLGDRQVEVTDRRPVIAPAGRVVTGAEDKNPKMHLTAGGAHASLLPSRSGASSMHPFRI